MFLNVYLLYIPSVKAKRKQTENRENSYLIGSKQVSKEEF